MEYFRIDLFRKEQFAVDVRQQVVQIEYFAHKYLRGDGHHLHGDKVLVRKMYPSLAPRSV
jgi:hypothetical protein